MSTLGVKFNSSVDTMVIGSSSAEVSRSHAWPEGNVIVSPETNSVN